LKRPSNLKDPQDSNSPYITQENLVVRGLLTVGNKKKNALTAQIQAALFGRKKSQAQP
jgi:hypothetical protein